MNSKHLLWKMALLLSCLLASTAAPIELHPIARPITWDSIAECYNQEIPAGSTFRSAEGEERYTQWKEEVKSRNVLIPDFIKESVLGFSNNP